jgi:hypothetical protein
VDPVFQHIPGTSLRNIPFRRCRLPNGRIVRCNREEEVNLWSSALNLYVLIKMISVDMLEGCQKIGRWGPEVMLSCATSDNVIHIARHDHPISRTAR